MGDLLGSPRVAFLLFFIFCVSWCARYICMKFYLLSGCVIRFNRYLVLTHLFQCWWSGVLVFEKGRNSGVCGRGEKVNTAVREREPVSAVDLGVRGIRG